MKKSFLAILFIFFISVPAMAQMQWNRPFQQYFDQYKDVAIDQMRRYRIPASITLKASRSGVQCR